MLCCCSVLRSVEHHHSNSANQLNYLDYVFVLNGCNFDLYSCFFFRFGLIVRVMSPPTTVRFFASAIELSSKQEN